MTSIVKNLFSWGTSRRRQSHSVELGGVDLTARIAREWGAIEVRRPVDTTNVGPYVGFGPTQ